MHRRALEPDKSLAELLPRGAERDALDGPSVAADRAQAQMAPLDADGRHFRQAMAGQGEQRLGRARAIRTGGLEAMDELRRRRIRRQGRVNLEASFGARLGHGFAESLLEEGAP